MQAFHGYTSPYYLNFSFSGAIMRKKGGVKFYRQAQGFMTGINKMKEAWMEVIIINTFVL
jgi:hypothetical protein